MKVGITFSQSEDICSSQIFATESTEVSRALIYTHERTGTSTNVTNDTLPFNYHYNITIELGNAAGSINVTGQLSKLPSACGDILEVLCNWYLIFHFINSNTEMYKGARPGASETL